MHIHCVTFNITNVFQIIYSDVMYHRTNLQYSLSTTQIAQLVECLDLQVGSCRFEPLPEPYDIGT